MSDIVERLRGTREWVGFPAVPICEEAADEIERLRAAASRAVRVWRREPSPTSEKIYDAMFALERALAGEQEKTRSRKGEVG